jgi:zinc protease
MNKFLISLCIVFSLVSCATQEKKSVTSLKTPDFEKITLDNGIRLYLISDKSLPYFTLQGVLAKGSAEDQKGKAGQASLTMSMLKEGSGNLNSEQYKLAYSRYSSELSIDVEKDLVNFKSNGLSKYSGEIAKLFLDSIFKPNFIQVNKAANSIQDFDKVREKRFAQITKSMEEASYYAMISFNALLFNESHYAMPEFGTISGVKKTLLSDVQNYYRQNVVPANLQFALTGNFSEETKKYLLEYLGSIKTESTKKSELVIENEVNAIETKARADFKPRVVVIDKPNLKQAEVRIGSFGPIRSDKDYVSLFIANSVLGSGDFNSRLMQEVRVKRGLVYGIYSFFNGLKDNGAFMVAASTRHDKVVELVETTIDILNTAKDSGLVAEDLSTQKSILLGQFPLKFETDDNFLSQIMRYKVYGFDDNYIQRFYDRIQNISLEEANLVLKNHYKPKESLIVIFASKKQLPADISKLGKIEYLDYRRVFN